MFCEFCRSIVRKCINGAFESREWVAMVKHIGIVGVSFEGAALCYRAICQEAMSVLGGLAHPEITMHTHSLSRYMDCIEKDDWDGVSSLMLSSLSKLAAVGADFGICPDITVHRVFDNVVGRSPILLFSIIEIVAKKCQSKGYRKVGILGTRYIMQGSSYRDVLARFGIDVVVPDGKDQEMVDSVIFGELVPEGVTGSSLSGLLGVIERLKGLGCDAVVLGCTELPLVIGSHNSVLPVVDSTRLLAVKALEYALGKTVR